MEWRPKRFLFLTAALGLVATLSFGQQGAAPGTISEAEVDVSIDPLAEPESDAPGIVIPKVRPYNREELPVLDSLVAGQLNYFKSDREDNIQHFLEHLRTLDFHITGNSP